MALVLVFNHYKRTIVISIRFCFSILFFCLKVNYSVHVHILALLDLSETISILIKNKTKKKLNEFNLNKSMEIILICVVPL